MKSHKQLCALSCAFGALISGAALSTFGLARAPQEGGSTQTAATNQAPSAAPATQPAVISDAKARALLGLFVGSWEVRGTTVGVGGASTGPFQGQCHFNWTLGGVFLAGDHVLYNQQGAALQMMDVMGFTPGVGFTRSEITNGDRSMFLSTGMYDDAPNALVFASSNPMVTPGGKQRSLDTSFLFRPDGTIVWNTTFEEEDSPVGTVKLVLTRMETPPSMQAPTTPFGAPMIAQGGGCGDHITASCGSGQQELHRPDTTRTGRDARATEHGGEQAVVVGNAPAATAVAGSDERDAGTSARHVADDDNCNQSMNLLLP